MNATRAFWQPIVEICNRQEIYSRAKIVDDDGGVFVSEWAWMLLMPVDGYLETFAGPFPVRVIEWVELSSVRVQRRYGGEVQVTPIEGFLGSPEFTGSAFSVVPVSWDRVPFEFQAMRIRNPFFERPPRSR